MDSPSRKEIGRVLQSLRKNAGFKSAGAFAESIGLAKSAYTEYEQGRRAFSYEVAWKMADALGCTLDELGGRDFTPPAQAPAFPDPRQAGLNASYESMNEDARGMLASIARSMERDPSNRGEPAGDQVDTGWAASA